MSAPEFGRLVEADIRTAWPHEARDFTPWLLENLDSLSEAIGIPLVIDESGLAVGQFLADALARNPQNDTRVLIENQLECSDHSHLGQILTYLAGLDAKVVVWVAAEFREPHLSAIRWLNAATSDEFAFFAVCVKVVRIGDSPFAPIFDVLARPNNWERQLHAAAEQSSGRTEAGERNAEFWSRLLECHPDEASMSRYGGNLSFRWRELPRLNLAISLYIAGDRVGVSVRGPYREPFDKTYERLLPYQTQLEQMLGAPLGEATRGFFFLCSEPGDPHDPQHRDRLVEWLHNAANRYQSALESICGGNA